jgi:hypothetical protein
MLMESTITDSAREPGSGASNVIRIDGVLLLTGLLGLFFLLMSWMCAIYFLAGLALGAYFAIQGNMPYLAISAAFMILGGLVCSFTRWIARGVLEGKKASAIIACILMIGFASFSSLGLIVGKSETAMVSGAVTQALVALALSLLLIASFRNRLYWGRVR